MTPKKRTPKTTQKKHKIVLPDTSVIAEGIVTHYVKEKKIDPEKILIHHAVLNELEHQANKGREVGYIGLEEVKKLLEYKNKKLTVEFVGERPGEFEIKFAKSGAVDNIIRQAAKQFNATLMTADRVQALVAEAQGIPVVFVEFEREDAYAKDPLGKYFDKKTMSAHFKEGSATIVKKGQPGKWEFKTLKYRPDRRSLEELAKTIVELAQWRNDSFIEIERRGSTIVQLGSYRIVIVKPPFGSCWEITAVRPVARLKLKDYDFPDKFKQRLENKAEGILVAGAPGEGKSTFTQALGEFYSQQGKIVKTVEAPRDLVLPDSITQYSATHGTPEEIRDVLLLNRPDYTIYDEIRNPRDFTLFADMRMAGVGMIGVVHATAPVDAIQRFIGRVEMGMVPHVIDTVVFIKGGSIEKVLSLKMQVKVPHGMTEADLARPVIIVKDFYADKPEYEIYTYGDQIAVIPVEETSARKSAVRKFAEEGLQDYFAQWTSKAEVELVSENKVVVRVPEQAIAGIIGKGGSTIQQIEEELGLSVDVQELSGKSGGNGTNASKQGSGVQWQAEITKSNIVIELPDKLANKEIHVYEGKHFLATATASKRGQVKFTMNTTIGKAVRKALQKDRLDIRA